MNIFIHDFLKSLIRNVLPPSFLTLHTLVSKVLLYYMTEGVVGLNHHYFFPASFELAPIFSGVRERRHLRKH